MQGDENVIGFSFDIELFQLDSNIKHISSEVQYSQNYIDVLGDIVEPFSLQVLSIEILYDEAYDEKTKIQAMYKCSKQVKYQKNQKQLFLMFFLLGKLLVETSLSTRELFNLKISKYTK